jgi:hypothetical protein
VLILDAELDIVRISQEELRLLRENSTRIEKLAEDNARLEDELERCKEASAKVEGLERENKRLAGELAQRLKQQQEVRTPKPRLQVGTESKSTPAPSDSTPSAARIEADESTMMVTKEKHQSLVAKYNHLWDKYIELKDARQKIEDALRDERAGTKLWISWKKIQDGATSKKDEKIRRLEEEIQRLRAHFNGGRGLSVIALPTQDGEEANESGREVARVVQVSVSSPVKGPRGRTAAKERRDTRQTINAAEPLAHQEFPSSEEPDLPAHRGAADMHVTDTQFEPIEADHTSSTEGSDPLSPNRASGHEQSLAEKPTTERSSSPAIEFISARSVKKRKTPHDSRKIKTEIKVETISSSPIGLARLQYLNPNESLDLDDIGEKVDTPKKQRRVAELTRQISVSASFSPLAAKLRSQGQGHNNTSEEEPGNALQETSVRRRDSILQPRSTNRQILPRTSEDRAPKKRRIASDEAVGELLEDGQIAAAATKPRRQTTKSNDRLGDLLAKPSPPKQVLSPRLVDASDEHPRSARTPAASGLARELRHPSQDAFGRIIDPEIARFDKYFPISSTRIGRESTDTSRPSSKGSSNRDSAEPVLPSSRTSLRESAGSSRPTSKGTSRGSAESSRPTSRAKLEEPSKPKSRRSVVEVSASVSGSKNLILDSTGTEMAHGSIWMDTEKTYLPPKRPPLTSTYFAKASPRTPVESSEPTSRHSAGPSRTTAAKPRGPGRETEASDWEIDRDQEPLRARPISRLNLSDFKVNPNYNQGYNYAFNEVVRGRDARQCLQGCTKPECCGRKFRTLAEMDREARGPPSLSQDEADEMLLEEYLGDNVYKIRNMSKAEKEELIIQAKTRDMANKFGRHRHAYERRTSPPGFWRADFPTTQEEREDREKAREIARSHVEERYKEAMRPNGRFIFRDE